MFFRKMGKRKKAVDDIKEKVEEKSAIVKQSVFSWSTVKTLGLIIFFYFFSISLTFYNRKFIHEFRLPLSITMTHLVTKFILACIVRSIWSHISKKPRVTLGWKDYLKRLAPPGIASSLDIGLSNWGLEYITISLYTMTKSTVIVFILLFSLLFRLEKMRVSLLVVVILIAVGVFMFNYESTQFHMLGFCLVLSASFLSGLRWTLSQMVLQKSEIGLSHPVDMMYHIQPWMMIAMLPLSLGYEGELVSTTENFFGYRDYRVLLKNLGILLCGAFLAFFLEMSEFLLVSSTSSLTLSISGIVKEVVTLLLAYWINDDKMTWFNAVGLVICLLGITVHVIFKAIYGPEDARQIKYRKILKEDMELLVNNSNLMSSDEDDVFSVEHDRMK